MPSSPNSRDKSLITSRRQLNLQQRRAIIEMFARGYTVRHVKQYLMLELQCEPSDDLLMRIAVEYSDDIEAAREQLAEMVFARGLATKPERLTRLTELAESWEARAQAEPKAASVYLKTLDQIRAEVEPLGWLLSSPKSDPWGQLLGELRDSARTSGRTVGTTGPDQAPSKST